MAIEAEEKGEIISLASTLVDATALPTEKQGKLGLPGLQSF